MNSHYIFKYKRFGCTMSVCLPKRKMFECNSNGFVLIHKLQYKCIGSYGYTIMQGYRNGLRGLYIREAQFSHAGIYSCIARTPLDTDTKSAMVVIRGII